VSGGSEAGEPAFDVPGDFAEEFHVFAARRGGRATRRQARLRR
jgi:hypothetical protein